MDGMGVWQVATRPLCVRMASNFYQGAKEGESPRRALHKCTVKRMLLQKGAVNYCGCISGIEGAYIRIVGASAPTKRYKITPLNASLASSRRPCSVQAAVAAQLGRSSCSGAT